MLLFPPPGDLPQRGIKPLSPVSPALQADPLLLTPLITSSHYLKFSPCHSLTMNLPLFSLLNVFLPCPLEKGMATHSSILAWKITWTEEPARLQTMESMDVGLGELKELVMDREAWHVQFMGSQRVGQDWATELILILNVVDKIPGGIPPTSVNPWLMQVPSLS